MKTRLFAIPTLAFVLLAWASPPAGAAESAKQLAGRVQALYQSVSDYTAKFRQDMVVKGFGRTEHDEGRAYFKKPGKMRWETIKEGRLVQLVVTDGKRIWFYSPVDNQVLEDELGKAFSKTPVNFLSGLGNVTGDFDVKASKAKDPLIAPPGTTLLDLTPKEKEIRESVRDLRMAVETKSAQVVGFSMSDALGNVTRVRLENVHVNEGLPDKQFEFKPPKGVDVVHPPSH